MKTRSTRPPADDPFASALAAARSAPEQPDAWTALEELAAQLQRPDEVAALYLEVLRRGLPPAVATAIGQRAVKFQEEWFGEGHPGLVDVLTRVVAIAPTAEWAFERLTVALTMQEKWGELLSAYDGALGADLPGPRRLQLLTEAAHLAKDLASEPDRAIGYLQQILVIKPADAHSDAALERLLERQERWRDLVGLWRTRLPDLPADEAQATRDRIATCLLERLGDARGALEEIRSMSEQFPDDARALTLAEQVLSGAATPADVRRDALGLLRAHHDHAGRAEEVVRALETVLRLSSRDDKRAVHRELAERLAKLGRVAEAIGHEEAILLLEPPPAEELAAARHLAEIAPEPARRVQLLERVAELEPRADDRREALGRAARLADELGQADRAIASWTRRLELDPTDRIALDAIIELDERHQRWPALVEFLERRAASAVAPHQRRADLVRIAEVRTRELGDVERAIESWRAVHKDFGEEPITVDALADLYERAGHWDELAALCERNARRESGHLVAILHRAGETVWKKLGDAERGARLCTRALEGDPAHEGARAALLALLDEPSAQRIAVEALARAAERTEDVTLARRIDARRVALAPERVTRVRFLEEAARREEAAGEPGAALDAMATTLDEFPDDPRLAREVERLGAAARAPERVVAALQRAVAALPAGSGRARELHERVGALLEQQNDDAGALAAYLEAGEPCRLAVVRTAGKLGRWDAVARTLVGAAVEKGALDEALLAAVEDSFETDWTELPRAVGSALAETRKVPASLAREIESRVAAWHADRAGDQSAAQVALQRAIAHAPGHMPTLRELAGLQRRTPGRPFVETLLKIADATPGDLDALEEAAKVALSKVGDAALARSVLSTLAGEALGLLRRGRTAAGTRPALDCALWSVVELAKLAGEAGEPARQMELLIEAARIAPDPEAARIYRLQAAEVASAKGGDRRRAVELYDAILAQFPDDTRALEALGRLYDADGRLADLLALRRHELALPGTPAERRVALRLEVARLVGAIEESGGRVLALRQNLDEVAGHDASVAALEQVLSSRGQYGELTDVLSEQAARLEGAGERVRAARLWGKAAVLAEARLADPVRAIAAHRKVAELDATPESLEALARLLVARGEHEQAIPVLARRLETADGPARTAMALRLADAYLATGRPLGAVECLERALSAEPTAHEVRRRLSDLYWTAGSWASLARLLIEGCAHAPDSDTIVAWAREAAEIHSTRLGTPDQAISALERAHAIAPEDRGLKGLFATALRAAGRLEEARKLLEELLVEFGRRRSPERAAVHLELARVAHAEGRSADALAELEQASSMDVSNVRILRTLADLARDTGELDRAERGYRSLLFILRRQKPEDRQAAGETIATSEILYELHRLAVQRGQGEAAQELLESALESAAASAEEVAALGKVLEAHGDRELLLRAIKMRLEAAHDDPVAQSQGLAAQADVLDALGRGEEALEARLDALEQTPGDAALHDATRAAAAKLGDAERYVERIVTLVDQGRRREDAALVADLLMRAGAAVEKDVGDLARARELYERAEATGVVRRQALEALARVAGGLGDRKAQLEALQELARGGSAESLYALAEGQLGGAETMDEGLQTLSRALELEAQYDRAMRLLDAAKAFGADVARVLPLYEWVARRSGDPRMLLDYLERRSSVPDATPEDVREAVEVAIGQGLDDRATTLRLRAVELARASSGGIRRASWALLPLAQARAAAGDREAALDFWLEAETVLPHDEVRAAGLSLAAGAQDETAVRVYERLLAHDPSSREVWEPLARLYEAAGNAQGLDDLCQTCLETLLDPGARSALRMARARVLAAAQDRGDDAVACLKDVLGEEPDHAEATALLAGLLERGGRDADLSDLLWRQLDAARDKGDVPTVRALAVRLGALLERTAPGDAKLVYRTALAVLPDDRALLRAALRLLGPEDDPGERAGLMERVLSLAQGPEAAPLALEVAEVCAALGDEEGLGRALARGYREAPDDAAVRARLERYYRDLQDFPRLAEMLSDAASRAKDPAQSVSMLREAAALRRDLGDPVAAAALLRRAREAAPRDLGLLEELVACLRGKKDVASGIEEIGKALEAVGDAPEARIRLLRLRADLARDARDEAGAVQDLEEALGLGGRDVLDDLLELLEQARKRAAAAGAGEAERAATLRLATLHLERGADEEAGAILAAWIDRAPADVEALRLLAELQESMGDWEALAITAGRLVEVEEGDAQLAAGLRLADVCRKIGRPGDARPGLEHVAYIHPGSEEIREHLRRIYEETGADRELAELLLGDAEAAAEEGPRFARLRQAGVLFLGVAEPTRAAQALEAALALRPGEHDTTMLLVDAYGQEGRFAEAGEILRTLIAAQKKKRSPEMSALLQRMAHLAAYEGDRTSQIEWLRQSLEADKNNGPVAVELADVAEEMGDWDTALKALQAVTLMKTSPPISHPVAFLRQARIAYRRGEKPRAVLWAKRALVEDPSFADATRFLKELGEG